MTLSMPFDFSYLHSCQHMLAFSSLTIVICHSCTHFRRWTSRYAAGTVCRRECNCYSEWSTCTPNGVRGKNPDQTSILAQMNQEVALGIRHMQSFMPTEAERRQNRIKSTLASANSCLTAAQVHGRDTTAILRQINRLENQLDDIINAI
jgi:hypothetical protein